MFIYRTVCCTVLVASLLASQAVYAQSTAVTLTTADTDPLGALDQLARFVGQRVRIPVMTVVAPTDGNFFYGVITGLNRPFRKPGLAAAAALPDGVCCVPRFLGSPELLRVDASDYETSVAAGSTLQEVTGTLQLVDGAYTIQLDASPVVVDAPAVAAVRAAVDTEFTVASLPVVGDSLDRTVAVIRQSLQNPDALTVADGAPALAEGLNQAIDGPRYQAFGDSLLVKTGRLRVGEVTRVNGFTVARLSAWQPTTEASTMTLILARLPQTTGADFDAQQERRTQAEALAQLVQDRQGRGERVLVAGDFQSYQFSDGYVDVLGTVMGRPAPAGQVVFDSPNFLAAPLTNLLDLLPTGDQYSAIENGEAVALDHILVSESLRAGVTGFTFARGNADFPASSSGRLSGRDTALGYVSGLAISNLSEASTQVAPVVAVTLSPGNTTLTIPVANISRGPARGPFHLLLSNLPAGISILNATGTVLGNPVISLPPVTTLNPGQSLSVSIQCQNSTGQPLSIPARVIAGSLQ